MTEMNKKPPQEGEAVPATGEFTRDMNKYLVLKYSDLSAALSQKQLYQLGDLMGVVERYRDDVGKPDLKAVVVESDWPEYEPVWQMIEGRVQAEQQADELSDGQPAFLFTDDDTPTQSQPDPQEHKRQMLCNPWGGPV